jgi:FKBP-type peptidyl-prolyl cis-trans isomerase FklB
MTSRTMMAIAIALVTSTAACAQQSEALSGQDRLSYALGLAQARALQKQGMKLDPKIASQGFSDALTGNNPRLSDAEARATLASMQKERAGQQTGAQQETGAQKEAVAQQPGARKEQKSAALKMVAAKNKAAGDAFLAENKAKPGVTTLASGLQYRVIQAGSGKKPSLDDTVSVNYRGTLIDGNEFGSTYKTGKPISFAVNKVIPGWREALPLMQAGSKWEIVVPAELAYGERMPSPRIGPNSTLIFELELVSVSGRDSVAGQDQPKQ